MRSHLQNVHTMVSGTTTATTVKTLVLSAQVRRLAFFFGFNEKNGSSIRHVNAVVLCILSENLSNVVITNKILLTTTLYLLLPFQK